MRKIAGRGALLVPQAASLVQGLQRLAPHLLLTPDPRVGLARARASALLIALASMATAAARVTVSGAGSGIVNGAYARRDASLVPTAFALVCDGSGWDAGTTWKRLNGPRAWWEAPNGSYMYLNSGDQMWWLDSGKSGLGLYVSRAAGDGDAPPQGGWTALRDGELPLPTVSVASSLSEL